MIETPADDMLDLGSAEYASPRVVAAKLRDFASAITETRKQEASPIAAYNEVEFGKRQQMGQDIRRLEREMAAFVRALPDQQLAKAIEAMNRAAV